MINLTREEAQQVLHSLLNYPMTEGKAIELLRAKLNEPPCKTGSSCTNKCERCGEVNPAEIHTCTPKREWVGLTDEEIQQSYETIGHYQTLRPQDSFAVYALAKAIEQVLKDKNNG